MNLKKMGLRIGTRRRELNMTQEELSASIEVTPKQISAIEKGRSGTSIETFLKICKALKTTPDFFCLGIIRDDPDEEILNNLKLCAPEDVENIRLFTRMLAEKNLENRRS